MKAIVSNIIKWASLIGFIASIILVVFSTSFFLFFKGIVLAVVTFVCYIYFGVDEEYEKTKPNE